jgi:hypothetical protein
VAFEVALDVDPDGEKRLQNVVMSGSMVYDGLVLDVLAPKPPAEGIFGTATFEEGTLAFDVAGGTLKDFEVEGADVAISGLESKEKPKHLTIDLTGTHPVATALDLLSGEPLDVLKTDRLDGLSGQTRSRLQLGLKLSGPERHLEWEARTRASDVTWPDGPMGLQVTEGDLTVDASPHAVEVRGTARANGVPAEIEYRQDLAGGDPTVAVDVRARVDEEGLRALGLPEQPYLSGTTALHVQYSRGADDLADITADLDVHDSQVEIRELDWQKPVGRDGGATIVARQQSERAWSVERFEVALESPDNRIQASLHRMDDDGYRLSVSGRQYNLQPSLERLRRGEARRSKGAGQAAEHVETAAPGDTASEAEPSEADQGLPPIAIDLRFDRLYLSPEARLDGFEASAAYDGAHWTRAAASATIEPEAAVSLTYGPAADGYRFEARADSAGEVMAALTGSGKARGGTLVIEGTGPSEAGPFEGRVEAKKVSITENIVLTRVLSLASLDGFVDNLTASHLQIRQGKVDFTLDDGVLQLKHGRIDFSGFLISLGGTVHFPRRQVAGHVAVAQLGRLQRFLGRIPVVGRLATGWNREGLFATHATIQGPLNDVEVAHVPMSTLTPGILRDILGISRDPDLEEEETDEPAGDEGAGPPETGRDSEGPE